MATPENVLKSTEGMNVKMRFDWWGLRLVICFALLYLSVTIAGAQQPQETPGQRGGTGDGFNKMEASGAIRNRRRGKSPQNRSYRTSRAFPDGTPPKGKSFVTVGVTVARGRLATDDETRNKDVAKVKGCVQWEDKKCASRKEMVLERVSDDSPVADKDQIQMTIEFLSYLDATGNKRSNSIGYLYVINREQFPDGAHGAPKLIFPTLNTYGGDNRVLPGKTVVMPDAERPWTISRSDSGRVQGFETYTIIVSPEPLKDISGQELQFEAKPIMLDDKLVASWIRLWGGSESRGDLENGFGQLVTQREVKSSGVVNSSKRGTDDDVDDLKQDDPPPQIIFRKIVSPGDKLLVTIKLPFKETASTLLSKP